MKSTKIRELDIRLEKKGLKVINYDTYDQSSKVDAILILLLTAGAIVLGFFAGIAQFVQ